MIFEQLKHHFGLRKLLFQASDHLNVNIDAVYSGFDPTAKSLHIGNVIPIMGLILCGQLRIKPYALIGSATAMIGDPTGRSIAKDSLSSSEIFSNATSISEQINNIYLRGMDISKCENFKTISIVNNLNWFQDLKLLDFLTDSGRHIKVNSMMSKNCVQSRLNSADSLTFCELSYQLMQGYDYLHLCKNYGVNFQIGGSDQWGNMTSGTELIGKKLKKDAAFLTNPLLTTASGQKMGKSTGNGIWLDPNMTSVFDFYQYFVSLSDEDAFHILPLLNVHPDEVVEEATYKHLECPSSHHIQKYLAKNITELIHGVELADQVEKFSDALFGHKPFENIIYNNLNILLGKYRFKIILRSTFLTKEISALAFFKHVFHDYSNSQLKNMIISGSLRLNYSKIMNLDEKIRIDELSDYVVVNYGKSSFYIIKLET